MAIPDLLQAPDGVVSCTACGAGPLSGLTPHPCPVEAARRVIGGAPDSLAAALGARAYAEGGQPCVEALAGCLRAMTAHVDATRAPGPLRVYVAGGAGERAQAAAWIARLTAAGIEVTHDWTTDPGWSDPAPTRDSLTAAARADLDGVRRCDVLWLLCPVAKSEGSACELGAALAWGKRVVVSGPWSESGRIFPGLAGERVATHEEGFAGVCRVAGSVGL